MTLSEQSTDDEKLFLEEQRRCEAAEQVQKGPGPLMIPVFTWELEYADMSMGLLLARALHECASLDRISRPLQPSLFRLDQSLEKGAMFSSAGEECCYVCRQNTEAFAVQLNPSGSELGKAVP